MERIRRLEGENIIIVTNNVEITSALVDENRAKCRELMADMIGPVVLIIDYREAKTNFAEIINIIKGNQAGKRADLNQRTFTMMVGTDKLINLYRDSMRLAQSGSVSIPYFDNMEAALATGRHYLAQQAKDDTA